MINVLIKTKALYLNQ